MALGLPFSLGLEVDLNIGNVGASPEKVVADEAVEIVWEAVPVYIW